MDLGSSSRLDLDLGFDFVHASFHLSDAVVHSSVVDKHILAGIHILAADTHMPVDSIHRLVAGIHMRLAVDIWDLEVDSRRKDSDAEEVCRRRAHSRRGSSRGRSARGCRVDLVDAARGFWNVLATSLPASWCSRLSSFSFQGDTTTRRHVAFSAVEGRSAFSMTAKICKQLLKLMTSMLLWARATCLHTTRGINETYACTRQASDF